MEYSDIIYQQSQWLKTIESRIDTWIQIMQTKLLWYEYTKKIYRYNTDIDDFVGLDECKISFDSLGCNLYFEKHYSGCGTENRHIQIPREMFLSENADVYFDRLRERIKRDNEEVERRKNSYLKKIEDEKQKELEESELAELKRLKEKYGEK